MQNEMHKSEEPGQGSEETKTHGQQHGTGQRPTGQRRSGEGGTEEAGTLDGENCKCRFRITTFPEHIGNFCGIGRSPYIIWVLLSLILLVLRISTMVICGEETGRFAVNIVQALLPGVLAILIIYYSRQTEEVAQGLCELFEEDPAAQKKINEETSTYLHQFFSNRAMIITGIIFTLAFLWMIKSPRLYPTPVHNIQHRAAVRDRITVNVGLIKPEAEKENNDAAKVTGWFSLSSGYEISLKDTGKTENIAGTGEDETATQAMPPDNGIWGWVKLPSGKTASFTGGAQGTQTDSSKILGCLKPKGSSDKDAIRLVEYGKAGSEIYRQGVENAQGSFTAGMEPRIWGWIRLPQNQAIGFTHDEINPKDEILCCGDTGKSEGVPPQSSWSSAPAVGGWIKLPLGKVIHLVEEMKEMRGNGTNGTREDNWYKLLTDPPQETYESHLPNPNHDEELGWMDETVRREIDPDWDTKFPSGSPGAQADCAIKSQKQHKPLEKSLIGVLEVRRARRLPPIIRDIYLEADVAQRWAYSQWTYMAVMVPLLFMSGAMLWYIGAIIAVTWGLGRRRDDGGKCDKAPLDNMKLAFYPHPNKSFGAAGDLLWRVAFITGIIYSLVMVCQFFAHPDTLTMIMAGMFSPLIVALFIIPQYNLHKLMVDAKYKEISALDEALSSTLKAIKDKPSSYDINKAQRLLRLQKNMAETNDWPCDMKALAMVVSTIIVPIFMAIFTLYEHFK